MGAIKELADALQIAGGWGVAAMLGIVCWRLWRQLGDKDERIFTLLDRQNEVLKALERLERKERTNGD